MLCTFTNPAGAPLCARRVDVGCRQHGRSASYASVPTIEFYDMAGEGRDLELLPLGRYVGFETVDRLLARDCDDLLSLDSDPAHDISADNLRVVLRQLGLVDPKDERYVDNEEALRERMATLLTGVANALRREPPPSTRWSWHDLHALAGVCVGALRMVQVVANSGALKRFEGEPWLRSVAGALAACDDCRIDVTGGKQ